MSRERFCDAHWKTAAHGDEERAEANGIDHVFVPEGEVCSSCGDPATHTAFVPEIGQLVRTKSGSHDGRPIGGETRRVISIDRMTGRLRLAAPEWDPADTVGDDDPRRGPELPWTDLRDLA